MRILLTASLQMVGRKYRSQRNAAMPVRSTMTAIIAATKDITGDPTNVYLTDQQVQDALDESRSDVRYELLTPAPWIVNASVQTSATILWLDYYSEFQYWETDEIWQEGHFTALTPVQSEPIVGHWVFSYNYTPGTLPPASQAPGQYPPVFASGKVYDLNRAAYKCLRLMIAKVATNTYNFSADGQTFNRYQIVQTWQAMMKDCALSMKPIRLPARRSDSVTSSHREHVRLLGNNDSINEGNE
jgi:hypothetical protein